MGQWKASGQVKGRAVSEHERECLFDTYRTTGADLRARKAQRWDTPEAEGDGQLLELTAYTLSPPQSLPGYSCSALLQTCLLKSKHDCS